VAATVRGAPYPPLRFEQILVSALSSGEVCRRSGSSGGACSTRRLGRRTRRRARNSSTAGEARNRRSDTCGDSADRYHPLQHGMKPIAGASRRQGCGRLRALPRTCMTAASRRSRMWWSSTIAAASGIRIYRRVSGRFVSRPRRRMTCWRSCARWERRALADLVDLRPPTLLARVPDTRVNSWIICLIGDIGPSGAYSRSRSYLMRRETSGEFKTASIVPP
jgi:hypothetical protein